MKVLSIIDVNPVIYQYLPALEYLAPGGMVRYGLEDVYTELIWRYIMELATRTYHDDAEHDYCLVMDSAQYFRKDLLPEYKGRRRDKPSCYYTAKSGLTSRKEVNSLHMFEADDLAAYAAVAYADEYDRIYIHTVDTDLYQLINDKTSVLLTRAYNPEHQLVDVRGVGRWMTTKVIRKSTKTIKGVPVVRRRTQYKKEAKSWTGVPHESICGHKMKYGDSSDNYKPGERPVLYDLLQSPIFAVRPDLVIGHTDKDTHTVWWESLAKARKQNSYAIRNPVTNPWTPYGIENKRPPEEAETANYAW